MTLSPEALAIAEAQAATDREMLARLVREGKAVSVPNTRGYGKSFVDDIEARVNPKRQINLAIRPKRKKRR